MIFLFILNFFNSILLWLVTVLPSANSLPFGIDSVMVSGIGYLRFFIIHFPPLGTVLTAFLIYVSFIISIKVIQLIPVLRNIVD